MVDYVSKCRTAWNSGIVDSKGRILTSISGPVFHVTEIVRRSEDQQRSEEVRGAR